MNDKTKLIIMAGVVGYIIGLLINEFMNYSIKTWGFWIILVIYSLIMSCFVEYAVRPINIEDEYL